MADCHGSLHRSLVLAFCLTGALVAPAPRVRAQTVSTRKTGGPSLPKPAGPLGTPVQLGPLPTAPTVNAADSSAATKTPGLSTTPASTSKTPASTSKDSKTSKGSASSRHGPPLGTPVGTPLGTPVASDSTSTTDVAVATLADANLEAANSSFTLSQLQYDRVKDARVEMRYGIKKLFRDRGLRYPAADIYLRVFKRERQLELWVRPEGDTAFSLLRTYDICALSGELGPKRAQGDNQVPEGFYSIDRFNPYSDYHLSLHVDYPNRSDQMSSAQPDLGGDIMIHGGCNSIGCLALTDEGIKQLYWVAVEARAAGEQRIPVDIYPARLDNENLAQLARVFSNNQSLVSFWKTLKPGFDYFEQFHRLPNVRVDAIGRYIVNNPAIPGVPTTAIAGPRPLGTPVKSTATETSASSETNTAKSTAKNPKKPAQSPLGTPVQLPPATSGGGGAGGGGGTARPNE